MATERPAKNSRCPCGSGKKYRKCHGKQEMLIAKVRQLFKEKEDQRRSFLARYGHARLPVSAMMGDKRMIVIGGSIYKQTQEGLYSFVNVLHDCGLDLFGVPYLEAEEAKPLEERHPALQWMYIYSDHITRLQAQKSNDSRAHLMGAGGAWIRFGYDLFTIRDNAKLEARMRKRLLDKHDFQAARHELAVAAMCIAAGFTLDFEDETDNSRTHAEFIATDMRSGFTVAVEAKSRRRRGVKGFLGGRDVSPGEEVGVRSLVLDALRKETRLPSYVFVDCNLPPVENEESYVGWLGELEQLMADLTAEGYATPSPANAIFFTNDPSHYILRDLIRDDHDFLWIKHYLADEPRVPHPPSDMVKRFVDAFTARISPPEDFPDFQ
jgi:hypothetical protein